MRREASDTTSHSGLGRFATRLDGCRGVCMAPTNYCIAGGYEGNLTRMQDSPRDNGGRLPQEASSSRALARVLSVI